MASNFFFGKKKPSIRDMTVDNFDIEEFQEFEKQEEIKKKLQSGTFDSNLSGISLEELNNENSQLSDEELKLLYGK